MNTIIVYTSMTGNTEFMAQTIANELMMQGDHVEIKDALDAYADELKDYDRILIGSYTWGDGDLPDEILDFYDELEDTDLIGKAAASFGSGDSSYDHFARAVDIFEQKLQEQGCIITVKGLKADMDSEEVMKAKCREFCEALSV
ncbi:flavodoxin [Bacillus dakarensis]|uniref:flavodoxin n=1 Tax=Robertmurraya dakarensis TaxID=1926278 RepID=UPI000981AB56|nr:flavodoxin [Bacillus dakarensis]